MAEAGAARKRSIFPSWTPLAVGMLLVLAVAVLTGRQVLVNKRHNAQVEHTLEVLRTGAALDSSLVEANATQRGMLLTAHPVFQQRYQEVKGNIRANRDALRKLISDNPAQIARFGPLDEVLLRREAEFDRTEALVQEGKVAEGTARVLIGRDLSIAARMLLDEMMMQEDALLDRRRAMADSSGTWLMYMSTGGLALAALLIGLSVAALRRRAADLEWANSEIRLLNAVLEERVEARTVDLAEANEEIQRFAYIVSHDLRSPLVNVMGFTSELADAQEQVAALVDRPDVAPLVTEEERRAITTDMPEALGFIRASTARMDRLIKAILELSRSGRRVLAPEPVDLGALFASLAVTLKTQLERADAQLEIGPMPVVEADRLALEQLFGNLLDNAVKYLDPSRPGQIRVSAEQHGRMVRVTVADNGRGIAAEDQERVFDLFRRAGPQDRPGEGIGLAHVRALARRLGGGIALESAPDEGSRFIVTLPRGAEDAKPPAGDNARTVKEGDKTHA